MDWIAGFLVIERRRLSVDVEPRSELSFRPNDVIDDWLDEIL